VILADPYHYSEDGAPAVADLGEPILVGADSLTSPIGDTDLTSDTREAPATDQPPALSE
jgi:hypothetical protein